MKTSKKFIAAAAVVLATAGVAAPVGIMTANAASAPVLKQGTRSQHVTSLQLLLRAHGANIAVDGSFGPATEKAVKDFQRSKGLQVDGVAGPATLEKLAITLKYGDQGNAVKALQQILRNSGATVAVDRSFGPRTRAAVVSFQRSKSLATDGVVGPKTWQALFGATSVSTPTPPPVTPGKPHPGDITRADLEKMFPGKVADTRRVEEGLPRLNAEMRARGINTAARKAAFLATLAHESTFDYAIGEHGYGSNVYRGRGYIQLTGDFNYRAAGDALGVNLMGANQSRASSLQYSAKIAGWYWAEARRDTNAAADRFDMGRVSRNIGYDNRSTASARGEDGRRCDSFKRAYKYLSGQNAPASTICARH
ncbi:peptidoglycan-binding protein [Mariniluteicoccus flavus]